MNTKRRALLTLTSILLLILGTIGLASTWQGSFGDLLTPEVSAAEKSEAAPPAQPFVVGTCDVASAGLPIEVESNLPSGPTAYATLGAAFADINAGVHQGIINVEVCFNSNEGVNPANLNSSGAGLALYSSVSIRPLADGLTITGNPTTGFGIIQLNGADNVTIDGDNPNSGGTNRNLTINNTTTTTVIANSVIRIATSAATPSADNNTFRNMNLNGNVTAGNAAAITSSAGSSNSSFGIYVGAKGGATAVTAPTNITSVNTAMDAATTTSNLTIDNNAINQCARGIQFTGLAAASSTGVTITNNTIGASGAPAPATPPYTSPSTTVYTKGILVQGTTAYTITGNTVQNILSYVAATMSGIEIATPIGAGTQTIGNNIITGVVNSSSASTSATRGITIASAGAPYTISGNTVTNVQNFSASSTITNLPNGIFVNTTATSATIEKNKVTQIYNRSTGTFGVAGIHLNGGNNITFQNNFLSDVNQDMSGGGAFSLQFGIQGLRIGTGTGHKIYHNSINLFGSMVGTSTSSHLTSALAVASTASTGMDIRNNIFANTLTGGTTSIAHVSVAFSTNSPTAMTLTMNNNAYYSGADAARQGIGQGGTTAGTGFYLATNFNAAVNTPATNLRALTTSLGLATNDNASFATTAAAPFTTPTDLHIPNSTVTLLESGGATVGLLTDIDGQTRPNGSAPDIGADEFTGVAPPANDIAANSFVVPLNGAGFFVGNTVTPQATFSNVGTATQTGIGVQFNITGPGGYAYTDNQVIASLANGASTTVTFAAAPAFTTPGAYTMSAVVTTADANGGNNTINGGFTVFPLVTGGTVTTGTGGTYPSLTNTGGVFDAINQSTVTSNIDVQIVGNMTGETGAIKLNEVPGAFTVTIHPTGAPRTITGSSANGLITLNGADGVTIDGSLSGGTDRSLTVNNLGSGAVIWLQSASATNGANTNTIKNVNAAGITPTGTFIGIGSGGAALGSASAIPNNNNVYRNNSVRRTNQGILSLGASAVAKNTGTVIAQNDLAGASPDNILLGGITVTSDDGVQVTENLVGGMDNALSIDSYGISLGFFSISNTTFAGSEVTNALVSRNRITSVRQTNTFAACGICVASAASGTNTIVNNMVTGVIANGTSPDFSVGIYVNPATGSTVNVYNNSVSMTGTLAGGSQGSFALGIGNTDSPINVRNNALSNTQVMGGTAYAIGTVASTFANLSSSFNDLYVNVAGANVGRTGGLNSGGGINRLDLAAWNTATGQDAPPNSVSVDPLFISATTDLHLQGGIIVSPLLGAGTTIGSVTNDYDNDPRPASNPDIGADEVVQAEAGVVPAGTFYNARFQAGNTLGGNVNVNNTLYLGGGGATNAGANTVGLGCNTTVVGADASNYIVGNVRKDFCGTGTFSFPVGTTPNGSARDRDAEKEATGEGFLGEYSPAVITINSGTFPSSLTISVVDTWLPGLGMTSSTSRYWNVTETGTLNADMQFQYLNEDVYGNEAAYNVFKYDGTFTTQQPGSVNAGANQFTATGVTTFSGWAAGVLAPTAASADISGRVLTADGRPIANVRVVLAGGPLEESISVYTGHLGYYSFNDLPVGQNYVVTVKSRRFQFADPSRVITLNDDLIGFDFTALPQQ